MNNIEKSGSEFNRSDLIAEIERRLNGIPPTVEGVVHAYAVVLGDALAEFGRVEIVDLGTFKLSRRAEKQSHGFSGEVVVIPEHQKITFKAAPFLKGRAQEGSEIPIL